MISSSTSHTGGIASGGFISARFDFHDETSRVTKEYVDKEVRALYHAGAYAVRVIRDSLKVAPRDIVVGRGKGRRGAVRAARRHSSPGDPPFITWPKSPLKQRLAFHVEEHTRTMVCGPLPHRTARGTSQPSFGMTVPAVLEHGGTVKTPAGETVRIEARPFVGPALPRANKVFLASLRG